MSKTRIFVDFWNLQLSLNSKTARKYWLDWEKLSGWLISDASNLVGSKLDYDGMNVYMSFDPNKSSDKNLLGWANNSLARLPGVNVDLHERKPKGHTTCPTCHAPIKNCPQCGNQIHKTVEKGVDTSIVTDLLGLAWERAWDIAILVSADRDYIPAVKLLSTKGFRIINAYIPPAGMELVKVCWANIDLSKGLETLELKKSPA